MHYTATIIIEFQENTVLFMLFFFILFKVNRIPSRKK